MQISRFSNYVPKFDRLLIPPCEIYAVFKAAILQLFGQRYVRAFSADRPSIRASLLSSRRKLSRDARDIDDPADQRARSGLANYRRSTASTNIHRS